MAQMIERIDQDRKLKGSSPSTRRLRVGLGSLDCVVYKGQALKEEGSLLNFDLYAYLTVLTLASLDYLQSLSRPSTIYMPLFQRT
jgi:hypothetical protein